MSWINSLLKTYDRNESDKTSELTPICHMQQKVQIEITLDQYGNFLEADRVPQEDELTIIPCTEESAGRSGTRPLPHPLVDKLQYIAGDFLDFYKPSKDTDHDNKVALRAKYLETLENWVGASGHPSLRSILNYTKKNTTLHDLVSAGTIFLIEDDGSISPKWAGTKSTTSPISGFVRWKVELPGNPNVKTWLDETLYRSWISFYVSSMPQDGLCQVTGKKASLSRIHPKSINRNQANAKLISSNDNTNFTYRGRFISAKEAYGISYEASQKVHAALKWLIQRQGLVSGSSVYLCWSIDDNPIPVLFETAFGFIESEAIHDTGQAMAKELTNAILGYKANISSDDQVVIMSLENATPGRLSITYFQELPTGEYIDRVNKWQNETSWLHSYLWKKQGDKYVINPFYGPPSPYDIIECSLGFGKNISDSLKYHNLNRIVRCIVDGTPLPVDLMFSCFNRAKNRSGLTANQFSRALTISCSLIRKYYKDYHKEDFEMGLDVNRSTRSYLYGRLLALAQNIESWALFEAKEDRLTNAERYLHEFSVHPYTTWKTIELSLRPYLDRLKGKASWHQGQINEVMSLFDSEDFTLNTPLEPEFLLAYHCQLMELQKRVEEKSKAKKDLDNNKIDQQSEE
ncbi:CRISPR-associated protein, Csd1 family [Clostridiaceae bacterium JG1575]|nr:CRISPR-associated protein, Csd1 family [Clostridiaceae bacterium JG1575]